MLFKKFIQQHCVHRFVAHGVGLIFFIAHHQVWVNLCHFLSYEPKLRDAVWITLLSVTEGHRLECEERFARLVHRFNVFLESCRRIVGPEAAGGINENRSRSPRNNHPANAGDISGRLGSLGADPDRAGLPRYTKVANIDVVIASGEIRPGIVPQADVAVAGGVAQERLPTAGCVAQAAVVESERTFTEGRVVVARRVARERNGSVSGVEDAGGVSEESPL